MTTAFQAAINAAALVPEPDPHDVRHQIQYPPGFHIGWRQETNPERLFLELRSEEHPTQTLARVQQMDLQHATLWAWNTEDTLPGNHSSGSAIESAFQAQFQATIHLQNLFTASVREARHSQGLPIPRPMSREQFQQELRAFQEKAFQAAKQQEAEEIAAGTRYRPTPRPWTARHRHVDAQNHDDEIGGLGWEIEGPPEATLRGQFQRAADAHAVAANPDMLDALLHMRDHPEQDHSRLIADTLAKALPLGPVDK